MYSGGIMTHYLFKTVESDGGAPKAKPEMHSILRSFHFADHSSDVQCSGLEQLSAITRVKKLLLASFGNLSDCNVLESSRNGHVWTLGPAGVVVLSSGPVTMGNSVKVMRLNRVELGTRAAS